MAKKKREIKGKNYELFEFARQTHPTLTHQQLNYHFRQYNGFRYPLSEFSKKLNKHPVLFVIYLNIKFNQKSWFTNQVSKLVLWFKEKQLGL